MRTHTVFPILAVGLGVLGLWFTYGWASDGRVCPDPMVRVHVAAPLHLSEICTLAVQARDAVSVCGLVQTDPVDIRVVERLVHDVGPCLASFDCDRNLIEILHPDALTEVIVSDDAYRNLPTPVVFQSLLAHEMVHMLVHQAAGDRPIPTVDHEFIANALELDALGEGDRQTLIRSSGMDWAPSRGDISTSLYMFAPRVFAVASWRLFERQGCAVVSDILDGRFSFFEPK